MKTADIEQHRVAGDHMAVRLNGCSKYDTAFECVILSTTNRPDSHYERSYTVRVKRADDACERNVLPRQVVRTWPEELESREKAAREQSEARAEREQQRKDATAKSAGLCEQIDELRVLLGDTGDDCLPLIVYEHDRVRTPVGVEFDLRDWAELIEGVRKLAERAAKTMTDEQFNEAKDFARAIGIADSNIGIAEARDNVLARVYVKFGAVVGHPEEAADIFEEYEDARRSA